MATFAVFGDIHGRITLMLVIARRWEIETGQTLDGVLQVGDFGAFPDVHRLDAATFRHAKKDSDELGFSEYLQGSEEGAALLPHNPWPVLWMRGNHEDFDYLSRFRTPTAVDPWRQLVFLPDGQRYPLGGLHFGAMGGMASRHTGRREDPRAPKMIDARLVKTAYADGTIDVLLTHAAPKAAVRGGSAALTALAERIRPRVHLFGHHHITVGPTPGPGGSLMIGLDHLEFVRNRLQSGCWGILEMDDSGARWTWGDDFRWISHLSRNGYRDWISWVARTG
ncbi:MAG: metallophosphoesterase [Myxococcota bacterium]